MDKKSKECIKLTDLRLINLENIINFVNLESFKQFDTNGIQTKSISEWNETLIKEIEELKLKLSNIDCSNEQDIDEQFNIAFKEAIRAATIVLKIAEMLYNKLDKDKIDLNEYINLSYDKGYLEQFLI